MPFLATEKIKVDPANRDIILPISSECNAMDVNLGGGQINERDESRKIRAPRDLSEVSRPLVQMQTLSKNPVKPTISPAKAAAECSNHGGIPSLPTLRQTS
jgi:hypothetical protein